MEMVVLRPVDLGGSTAQPDRLVRARNIPPGPPTSEGQKITKRDWK